MYIKVTLFLQSLLGISVIYYEIREKYLGRTLINVIKVRKNFKRKWLSQCCSSYVKTGIIDKLSVEGVKDRNKNPAKLDIIYLLMLS